LNPDGGMATQVDPKTGLKSVKGSAGDIWALPWGVKFSDRNSQFPSANASAFRKDSVRAICAGMPGADYNTVANDLENINFSAGRLGRLDTNEMSKLIQTLDIECAERPIFEDWLEMSMIMGVLEFDYSAQKFEKFNKPVFQGRRWSGVDEVKEATAAALRIQNNESNWTEESAENGKDFEELMFQKAEDLMLMEELGIDTMLTATPAHVAAAQAGDEDDKPNPPKPESDDDEHDPTIKSRVE
jgi:capsid protein